MYIENKEKKYYVYMYTSPSGKHYVGRTCQSQNQRAGKDGSGYISCRAFWNAIQKYGWENFNYEVLETNIIPGRIDERENYWIDFYHSSVDENGYNLLKPSNTKKTATDETRQRMSKAHSGENCYWYGKHRPFPKEALEKAVEANNKPVMQFDLDGNYIRTFESRKEAGESVDRDPTQISECCNTKGKSCAGYQWCNVDDSDKIKPYINKHETVGTVVQLLNNTVINVFKNAKKAAKETGINATTIYKCIKQRTIGCGFYWIRISEVDANLLNEYYKKNNQEHMNYERN